MHHTSLLRYVCMMRVFKTRTLKGGVSLFFVRKWEVWTLFGVTEFDGNLFCIICYDKRKKFSGNPKVVFWHLAHWFVPLITIIIAKRSEREIFLYWPLLLTIPFCESISKSSFIKSIQKKFFYPLTSFEKGWAKYKDAPSKNCWYIELLLLVKKDKMINLWLEHPKISGYFSDPQIHKIDTLPFERWNLLNNILKDSRLHQTKCTKWISIPLPD